MATDPSAQARDQNFRIEVTESTSEYVLVQIKMPTGEFKELGRALSTSATMDALCAAAKSTGLDKVLQGSWYCTACEKDGVQHQHRAKNWFSAFVESLTYCGPTGFALHRGQCRGIGPIVNHDED